MITLTVIALAAGCASSAPAIPGNSSVTTIVWLADPTAQTATDDVREVLADAFEKAYPSISVELETGPPSTDSLRSLLVSRLSSGSPTPDVYAGDVVWPYSFAHSHYALPLSRYLPASFWSSFVSSAGDSAGNAMLRAMTYQGEIYGVPEFIDESFLYYRKDLLAQAGLRPPRTWEELVADSNALKRKGAAYQFVWQGNNYEGLTADWYEFLADALGRPPRRASPAADIDSVPARKALGFLRSLINEGVSPSSVRTFEETDADNAFDSGKAAFLRGWDSSYSNAVSANSKISAGQVGVEPLPDFRGQAGPGWSALGGWGLFVNPRTQNLRAALTFAQWMAGQQAQWILATQYSEIPGNAAIRDNPAALARSPVLRTIPRTRLALRPAETTDYARVSNVIYECVNAALQHPAAPGEPYLSAAAARLRRHGPPNQPCAGG